jgi:putative ABC transport system ATP-binding protein
MAHGTIPILRLENLCYEAGGKAIVCDVSVEVRRGDFFAVVGPSGAGKSTLLRLLNRLDEPSGGTVYLEGRDYRQLPPAELRRRVGMVMQAANLFPGTVADNLRFGPQQRGEEVSGETIAGLLERVGLSEYEERDVSNLSGGEAQRVSLARTLANTPEILLLDEPTSALDDAARHDVEELICSIVCEQELTALIVTHDMEQAARMVSQVIVLEKGRLVRSGPLEEALYAE